VTDPGPDGYGPPPTPEVVEIRDKYFGEGPPPRDEKLAARIEQRIHAREATVAWKRH
jgi:hypothetical protein